MLLAAETCVSESIVWSIMSLLHHMLDSTQRRTFCSSQGKGNERLSFQRPRSRPFMLSSFQDVFIDT